MLKKRNSSVSIALECALLLLAIFVFSWGLHAKLVLYHTAQGKSCTTNSMAKLSAENRIAQTADSVENQDPLRFALQSLHFVTFFFSLQGHQVSVATVVRVEGGPGTPGQYYLHGPDLKRRPPPVRS